MTRASDLARLLGAGATINDGTTITTADNTDQLSLISTDTDASVGPVLNLQRDSSSPADDDAMGTIDFRGENSASEIINYVRFNGRSADVTDGTEDGKFDINTYQAGASVNRLSLTPTETVLNEDSVDLDFRVESNGDTHALFVQGGSDCVGIKTTSPNDYYADDFVVTAPDEGGMSIVNSTTHRGYLAFADGTSGDARYRGYISYDHNTDDLYLGSGGSGHVHVGSTGTVLMPNQPCFSATADTTNIPLATATTLALSGERFDVGGNLDANTFTAPISGKYLFCFMFYFSSVDADHTTLDAHIKTSNKQYQVTFSPDHFLNSDSNFSITGSMICDMDANDTCIFTTYVQAGAAQTDVHTDSQVSGALLC